MKVLILEQRSNDWLTWRNTGLGSSDAAKIVGMCPPAWGTAETLLQQKVAALIGQQTTKRDSGAMARGRNLEPKIIALYEDLMGFAVPAVCAIHDEHEWLKASLDGYNAERQLFVEAKAPNRDDHNTALAGNIPEKYIPQLLHQYLVTDAKLCHYISFSDYFPPGKQLAVVPYYRDAELAEILFKAEKEFWMKVLNAASQIETGKRKKTPAKKETATR